MADKLHEAEFWLPSEFLTDEDILMDNKENLVKSAGFCFPSGFPYDYGSSVLSSPVESVVGSTETESDEDESLLCELTRQLTVHDTHKIATPAQKNHEKAWVLSGSPQSTLTQVGSWSGRSTVSSNGSPNGPSQVSSPPTTPLGVNNDAWELIYQAAGQVARLKMNGGGDGGPTRNTGLLGPPRHLPTPPQLTKSSPSSVYHDQLKQETSGMWSRHIKSGWGYDSQEVLQNMGARIGGGSGYGTAVVGDMGQASCGWPSQQQGNQRYVADLGMKVGGVHSGGGYGYGFSYGSGGGGGVGCWGGGFKKERSGTGVFLPRRYDHNSTSSFRASDSRKKPGISSVWVPNKVVQGSYKNFDNINEIVQPKSSRYNADFIRDFDALVARRNALLTQQRQRSPCPEGSISHEICLPQEWTY